MPKVDYYDDVKVIKKPLKTKVFLCLKIFFAFIIFGGCFWGGRYVSEALTVGELGGLIVFGDTKISLKEKSLYAVTLGEYDNYGDAEKVAMGATIQGAGGYVWNSDKYYVVGSVYSSYNDAESVVANLKSSKYNVGVMEVVMPRVLIDFDMYNNSDMKTINKSFEIFNQVYAKLYDYSISYDKGEIVHLAVSSNISALRGEVKSIIVNVQNLINQNESSLSVVQEYLVKLDEILDQAIIKTIDNSSTNYSLKYALTSVVRMEYEMLNNLSV